MNQVELDTIEVGVYVRVPQDVDKLRKDMQNGKIKNIYIVTPDGPKKIYTAQPKKLIKRVISKLGDFIEEVVFEFKDLPNFGKLLITLMVVNVLAWIILK